jgi:hypothetical protein
MNDITLKLDYDTAYGFFKCILKQDYFDLKKEAEGDDFEHRHPEDQLVTLRTMKGMEVLFDYYFTSDEAQDIKNGIDPEDQYIRV